MREEFFFFGAQSKREAGSGGGTWIRRDTTTRKYFTKNKPVKKAEKINGFYYVILTHRTRSEGEEKYNIADSLCA
jgi:hypothetical protein